MVKFIIMATTDDTDQKYAASILGGYDSTDTDRLVVMLGYSGGESDQHRDYPPIYNTPELESLTFNN